ncbi:MAG: MFS transporter [Bacteroides sp.]|nr:MFS transporter [Bacteroides sp.]
MNIKTRLIIMSFLQFAVWGAYLTSMGGYLASVGIGDNIGWFYSVQGFVSLFMPGLIGIVADRWIQAQRLLGFCHFLAAIGMIVVGQIGMNMGNEVTFAQIFPWYTMSVAFYMPTLALSNSVSYSALEKAGLDTIKAFPPIRIFGTIGFIVSMWIVDLCGLQHTHAQFSISAVWSLILGWYAFTLPSCPIKPHAEKKGIVEALGLNAFKLFKQRKMALFFLFSMMLGVSLQITNGYANPFISSFAADPAYQDAYFTSHANLLISLSQCSETLCILLIPFFLKRYGIKRVMLIAMVAWALRFGFFAIGNPGFPAVTWFILSMIVYGVAFDFFNISGSLFVDQETDSGIRSSAQGLFMMMTNGIGASLGMIVAQGVVNAYTHGQEVEGQFYTVGDWPTVWLIFAAYALAVGLLFAWIFKYKHTSEKA